MSLPTVTCPACNSKMDLDALLGHQGARDALLALAQLHPAQSRAQMVALRYCGLFAPAKQALRFDRIASLLHDMAEMIGTGTLQHKGQTYTCPLSYWIDAMEHMVSLRSTLQLPLKSHGYLKSILAGNIERSQAQAETTHENQRAGRTPVGHASPTVTAAAHRPFKPEPPQTNGPRQIPDFARQALKKIGNPHSDKTPAAPTNQSE